MEGEGSREGVGKGKSWAEAGEGVGGTDTREPSLREGERVQCRATCCLVDMSWSQHRHSSESSGQAGPQGRDRGQRAVGAVPGTGADVLPSASLPSAGLGARKPPSHALRINPLQNPQALHAFLFAEGRETGVHGVGGERGAPSQVLGPPNKQRSCFKTPKAKAKQVRTEMPQISCFWWKPHPPGGEKARICGRILKRATTSIASPTHCLALPSPAPGPPRPCLLDFTEDKGPSWSQPLTLWDLHLPSCPQGSAL